jgi:hypothetical protein
MFAGRTFALGGPHAAHVFETPESVFLVSLEMSSFPARHEV